MTCGRETLTALACSSESLITSAAMLLLQCYALDTELEG